MAYIAIVKKTFRLRKVFLLQALMPPSFYSERIYDKRYNPCQLMDMAIFGEAQRNTTNTGLVSAGLILQPWLASCRRHFRRDQRSNR